MKILITIWLSVLATFAFVATLLLRDQASINVPGELGEAIFGVGAKLVILILVVTVIIYFNKEKKDTNLK